MAQNTSKKINIDGLDLTITKFGYFMGISIRAQLVRCLLPAIAQLTGEGLKSVKTTNKEEVSKMTASELIANIDGDVLAKAATSLASNMSNLDYEIIMRDLLSVCVYENKQLSNEIEKLFIQDRISYSTADKIAFEVIKHQGFFGDLVAKLQDKIQN